jgi:hypothetical protein
MATSSIRTNSLLIKQKKELTEILFSLCWEAMDGNEQYSNKFPSDKTEKRAYRDSVQLMLDVHDENVYEQFLKFPH